MATPESPQDEIDFHGINSADMAQLPLGIIKRVRWLLGSLHQKMPQSSDQYHPSSQSSAPNQRHYGTESREGDYRPNHLGILGDGFGAVGVDYANQLAQTKAVETRLGHPAIHETLEGIPVDNTRPKID